jgi:hypothetical protein
MKHCSAGTWNPDYLCGLDQSCMSQSFPCTWILFRNFCCLKSETLDCKFLIKQMATIDRYWIWHLIRRKQRKWVVIPYELYFLQMRLQHVQMLTDIYEFCLQLVFVSCTRTNIIENAACQDLCFHFDAIVGLIEPV